MTAISLMAECKKALPDAQVFVLIDGRYKRVEKVLLTGVDPVVTGLTSVCLDGEPFVSGTELTAAYQALTRHDDEARAANFDRCGCEYCRAIRPLVEAVRR